MFIFVVIFVVKQVPLMQIIWHQGGIRLKLVKADGGWWRPMEVDGCYERLIRMKNGRSGLWRRQCQFGELIGLVSGLFNEDSSDDLMLLHAMATSGWTSWMILIDEEGAKDKVDRERRGQRRRRRSNRHGGLRRKVRRRWKRLWIRGWNKGLETDTVAGNQKLKQKQVLK